MIPVWRITPDARAGYLYRANPGRFTVRPPPMSILPTAAAVGFEFTDAPSGQLATKTVHPMHFLPAGRPRPLPG